MPIHHNVIQGEDAWFEARLGIPTASNFGKIMTPKTMKLSAQAKPYADLKIAELMTGESQGIFEPTFHMRRGQILEVDARRAYEMINGVKTETSGFITNDKKTFGCSPDFLIGDDGCGEIKCLDTKNHVTYMIENVHKAEHTPQIQGQLWVSDRQYCDYWLYHPDLMPVPVRVERDEAYIKELAACMESFRDLMSERIAKLQRLGRWSQPDNLRRKGC